MEPVLICLCNPYITLYGFRKINPRFAELISYCFCNPRTFSIDVLSPLVLSTWPFNPDDHYIVDDNVFNFKLDKNLWISFNRASYPVHNL